MKIFLHPFHCILLLVLFGLSASIQAQNISRAFRMLERLDYERATEIFQDALESDENLPSASFGLAMIYADDQSPSYDLVQAWSYVNITESTLDDLNQDEIDIIGEYFINTEERRSNRPVKTKMEYAIAIVEAKLIKYIREENNLDLVYEVIEKFPDFRYYDNIIHIRNQLEFRKYEKQHTLGGYREFMERFPDAAQIGKAQRYISSLSFEQTVKANTVDAYRTYIDEFPSSPEYNTAVRNLHSLAFAEAKNVNTMQAMETFMEEYPDALEIAEAWEIQKELLYEYATKIQTLEAYNEFIRKYPEGQQYIDIFNLKSLDLGMKYMAENPIASENLQWTRSFEMEGFDALEISATVDNENEYIIGGNIREKETGKRDIWIIKTGDDGKMIWNRTIGEFASQELQLMVNGVNDEIIGLGTIPAIINDSTNHHPWIFKISAEGNKSWSMNFDEMFVSDMICLGSGQIILGGFMESDSLGNTYSLAALNDNGRKLWSRDYSLPGKVHSLLALPDDQVLMSGDHWSARIDARGYIIWETPINMTDSMTSVTLTDAGEILYAGLRSGRQVFVKTDQDNNMIFEKEYDMQGTLLSVSELRSGGNGTVVALCRFLDHDALQWINASTGNIEKTVDFPGHLRIFDIFADKQKNLLITGLDDQFLLIKNFGMAF